MFSPFSLYFCCSIILWSSLLLLEIFHFIFIMKCGWKAFSMENNCSFILTTFQRISRKKYVPGKEEKGFISFFLYFRKLFLRIIKFKFVIPLLPFQLKKSSLKMSFHKQTYQTNSSKQRTTPERKLQLFNNKTNRESFLITHLEHSNLRPTPL